MIEFEYLLEKAEVIYGSHDIFSSERDKEMQKKYNRHWDDSGKVYCGDDADILKSKLTEFRHRYSLPIKFQIFTPHSTYELFKVAFLRNKSTTVFLINKGYIPLKTLENCTDAFVKGIDGDIKLESHELDLLMSANKSYTPEFRSFLRGIRHRKTLRII